MKIYTRYIFLKLVKHFLLINTVIIVVISLFQMLKFIYLISKGALLFEVIDLVVLSMPSMLYVVLPISTMLSCLYTYNSLIKNQEITILRGAALSNFQIASPALVFSIIITILTYYITISLAPSFYTQLKNKIFEIKNNYTIEAIEANSFNRLNKYITVYLGNKTGRNSFENILIFDKTEKSKVFIAKRGELKFQDEFLDLTLRDGAIQSFDEENQLTSMNFVDFFLKISLYNQQRRSEKDMSEHTISELLYSKNAKFVAEANQRILWPSYNFVLVFFAIGAFLYKPKNLFLDKVKLILYTFALIIIYFMLSTLGVKSHHYKYFPYLWTVLVLSFSLKNILFIN